VHARILATATIELPDPVVAKVQAQVLKRAPGQTPGEFRAAVRRAIALPRLSSCTSSRF
jgi:hypothetical protein